MTTHNEVFGITESPAMPELPKPFAYLCDWGNDSFGLPRQIVYYDEPGNAIDDDWNERPKVRQNEPFYTADQMRAYALATLQAQQSTQGDAQAFVTPAEVSDAEINRLACLAGFSPTLVVTDGGAFARFARAILALRPQSESEQEKELRSSLTEAQATISERNAEIIELQKRIRRSPQAVTHEDWPLRAKVWRRDSTSEWVLEISGTLCDTYMNCRHTQPLSVQFEDVPGLPTLYEDAQAVPMTDEQIVQGQGEQGAQSILSFMKGVRHAEAFHRIGITTHQSTKE